MGDDREKQQLALYEASGDAADRLVEFPTKANPPSDARHLTTAG